MLLEEKPSMQAVLLPGSWMKHRHFKTTYPELLGEKKFFKKKFRITIMRIFFFLEEFERVCSEVTVSSLKTYQNRIRCLYWRKWRPGGLLKPPEIRRISEKPLRESVWVKPKGVVGIWRLDGNIDPLLHGSPKGNQSLIFIGRTDAPAPILWPPVAKNWFIGKD